MKADDFGNYTANIKLLKAALFPLKDYSDALIDEWIRECVEAKIVLKYTIEGKDYINIPNFGQRLRAMKSQYPDIRQSNDGQMTADCLPETNRNEVETNGREIQHFGSFEESKNYVIISSQQVGGLKCRVNGADGLNELFQTHKSKINYPEMVDKFMRAKNGAHFNEFMHVYNSFTQFVEKHYAR